MNEKLKKMEKREDGFLEIELSDQSDFDDYLFAKMREDASCLLCIRDPHRKTHLFYDLKGFVTLEEYLQRHTFEKGEFLAFLIFLLEDLVRVNSSKPIYLDIAYLFLSADGHHIRFLVLPLQEDGWIFQKRGGQEVMETILMSVKTSEDYETVGLLVQLLKQSDFSLPNLLQHLHLQQEQNRPKLSWWQRIRHKHQQEPFYAQDMPVLAPYPSVLPEEISYPSSSAQITTAKAAQSDEKSEPETEAPIYAATEVLFAESSNYLIRVATQEWICLKKDPFTIGRSPDNDLCLKEAAISSYHARISIEAELLEDLHSSNGTLLNKKTIHKATLHEGDYLTFANLEFQYHAASAFDPHV